jgi:hypothetical protein
MELWGLPMAETPRLVSLDQFRRKRPDPTAEAEPASHAVSSSPLPPTPIKPSPPLLNPRTEKRIKAAMLAIEKLTAAELEAIADVEAPKQYRIRFSAAAVAREAGIGRTQLYEGNSDVQRAIEAARAELDKALDGRRSAKRPSSKQALEERIAALEAEHEAALSRLTSQQMSDLIRRMGPVLDASQRAGNSDAETQARIRQLEQQLQAQVAANQILLGAMSTTPKKS